MDRRLLSEKRVKDNSELLASVAHVHDVSAKCGIQSQLKYQEYFPPEQVFTNAIRMSELWRMNIPEYKPLSKFNLFSLMDSIKQYPTSEHVCLIWSKPPSHCQFNAYSLQIVRPKDLNNSSHLILNKHGFLFFSNGFTEYIPMDDFEREINLFERITEIKFFKQFRLRKGFVVWRLNILGKKSKNNSSKSNMLDSGTTARLLVPTPSSQMRIFQSQILSTKSTLYVSISICELVEQNLRKCKVENDEIACILKQLHRNDCQHAGNQKKLLSKLLNSFRH